MAKPEMEVIVTTLHCTLREWYAGLAMQALIQREGGDPERDYTINGIVDLARVYAERQIMSLEGEE